jgi:biotin synthase
MNAREWSDQVLAGKPLERPQALDVMRSSDDELLGLIQAAFEVRRRHFGRDVNLHVLNNAKSGLCSENCSFCSQSAVSDAAIDRYPMKGVEELVAGARDAARLGAVKYCMVTSGRSPSEADLEVLCDACRRIKAEGMRLHLCVSPGLLDDAQATALKKSGADRINHNLETSRRHFPRICGTHSYDDRVRTIRAAQAAGLEICSGGLMGMGEEAEDRVDLALALRELKVNSIPVNFLDPRAGTPLAGRSRLSPAECLRTLAMFRLVYPAVDLRAAGGRETCLRHLQPLALYVANSIFTEGYLTTDGQGHSADLAMIEEAGFRVASIEA